MAEGLEPCWSYGATAQEDQLDRFKYIYSKFGKYVLSFASSEPYSVADGVADGDEDEEDLVKADLIGHHDDSFPVEPGMTMLVKPGMTESVRTGIVKLL